MKHISWVVLIVLVAATAMGQASGVTVSLAATPANTTQLGQNILLTATVTTPGLAVQPVGGGTVYERDRMRFSFKAQKTWPCAGQPVTIAENVLATSGSGGTVTVTHVAATHFVQPAAGEYALSVDVTYLAKTRLTSTGADTPLLRPQKLGNASIAKYVVKPSAGFPHNIILTAYPPTNTAVSFPASVQLTATVTQPGEGYKWSFIFEAAGCNPYRSNRIESSSPTATWTTTCSTAGAHNLYVYVEKIRVSDCLWAASGYRYDYGYFLKAQ